MFVLLLTITALFSKTYFTKCWPSGLKLLLLSYHIITFLGLRLRERGQMKQHVPSLQVKLHDLREWLFIEMCCPYVFTLVMPTLLIFSFLQRMVEL